MAGRGRGKSSSTFTQEQLQSLGVTGKDMPSVTSAPPPLFPLLLSKPVSLESNHDRDYKILWKEDFISYLRESPYYTTMKNSENKVQRYSDKVINALENDSKQRGKGEFIYSLMPAELKPTFKRVKKPAKDTTNKKLKVVDFDAKLKELEQKENLLDKVNIKKEKMSDSEDENEDEQEEVPDEEMDEENDYGNNYFDNGEAYNEEDDNLDDGPTY